MNLSDLELAINQKNFPKATKIAHEIRDNNKQNANFWFLVTNLTTLTKDFAKASYSWQTAKSCSNYSDSLEGDFLRDRALAAVRAGQINQAKSLIERVKSLHKSDNNRMGAATFVEGRIALKEKRYQFACTLFDKAAGMMTDPQWTSNSRFWLLVATSALHLPSERLKAYQKYHAANDPSRLRRWAALSLLVGGKPVYSLIAR